MPAVRSDDGNAPARTPASASSEDGRAQSASPVGDKYQGQGATAASDPPLPDEVAPPLPDEAPPQESDDGWEYRWADVNGAPTVYFYNHFTGQSQWENPRVPAGTENAHIGAYDRSANVNNNTDIATSASGSATITNTALTTSASGAPGTSSPPKRPCGGYNPAIHGNYDPTADYALAAQKEQEEAEAAAALQTNAYQNYAAQANFNRFTGKFQQADMGPEMHNDENKSKRQLGAFFDVDAAANSHDGRSLKAERRNKTLTKKELKHYQEKKRAKKEAKRREWLKD